MAEAEAEVEEGGRGDDQVSGGNRQVPVQWSGVRDSQTDINQRNRGSNADESFTHFPQ